MSKNKGPQLSTHDLRVRVKHYMDLTDAILGPINKAIRMVLTYLAMLLLYTCGFGLSELVVLPALHDGDSILWHSIYISRRATGASNMQGMIRSLNPGYFTMLLADVYGVRDLGWFGTETSA